MFSSRLTPPTRLSLDDFELVVALSKQRAATGDDTHCRVAEALDNVLQLRRARAAASTRPARLSLVAVTPCRHRLQAVARRCWAGMNMPLSLGWARDGANTLASQR